MRILVLEPDSFSDEALRILRASGDVSLGPMAREQLLESVGDFDVLFLRLGHVIDSDVLRRSKLKYLVTPTTGLDHIDLKAAQVSGTKVLSLRDHRDFLDTVSATPEHTWALLLSLIRRIPWAHQHVVEGGWNRDLFRGRDLSGARLGLLGVGRVGSRVAGYGRAFGMEVTGYDPYRDAWPKDVSRATELAELLSTTDVLSIHVHLTDETTGILDEPTLRALPHGAVIVNTSRGEILDEAAVVRLLEDGSLAGGAFDVLAGELDRERSPLRQYAVSHQNVVLTPHIAGATEQAMRRTEVHMAKALAAEIGRAKDSR